MSRRLLQGLPSLKEEGVYETEKADYADQRSAYAMPEFKKPWLKSASKQDYVAEEYKFFFKECFTVTLPSDSTLKFTVYYTPPTTPEQVLFISHHGAGSSALSFAHLAAELQQREGSGFLAFDARGHGGTTRSSHVYGALNRPEQIHDMQREGGLEHDYEAAEEDYSLETLCQNLEQLTSYILDTKFESQNYQIPDLILIGHSLGGSVVTSVAQRNQVPNLIACVVLDVVEGSAIEALRSQEAYLASRPAKFSSLNSAIDWHLSSRTLRDRASARISVPPLLIKIGSEFRWRTDLLATKRYWPQWFAGMSKRFLAIKGGKLLVLAATDTLDKELMIAQMQGSYQLSVLPETGHFLHEDNPSKLADLIISFASRYQNINNPIPTASSLC